MCSGIRSPRCSDDLCPFSINLSANAVPAPKPGAGRSLGVAPASSSSCRSCPWLTAATVSRAPGESFCPPRPGPGSGVAVWGRGPRALSLGQSMTCAGSRAHLLLCAARSRLEGRGPEEGALPPPQPEVQGSLVAGPGPLVQGWPPAGIKDRRMLWKRAGGKPQRHVYLGATLRRGHGC